MLLGCIGDDFTGSSDLANTLAKQGMRTVQYTGIPDRAAESDVEAGVVALKSRSIEPTEAVRQSLEALEWLKAQGCRQFFFKYCSTFDSTKDGNIGPVADALAEALDADRIIVCPAFPGTGRSLYQGHLFVGDKLLNESGLENHPLNPMTDPDIRRWLSYQSDNRVGHVPVNAVMAGPEAIGAALDRERAAGNRLVVVDALRDEDLIAIGAAAADLPLVTGGSGVALGLPANFVRQGLVTQKVSDWTGQGGRCAILSGSCSTATRGQIAEHAKSHPVNEIDAGAVIEGRLSASEVAAWILDAGGLPLAFSSAEPEAVTAIQERYGRERSAEALEHFFAETARALVAGGTTRLICAGGETSGAVVEGLKLDALEIGPEIDPGVPALRARPDLVVALKSGNFGAPDFFAKAAGILEADG